MCISFRVPKVFRQVSRSGAEKSGFALYSRKEEYQSLRDTRPRKRMKLYIRYYAVEFHVDSRSDLVEGLCFFSGYRVWGLRKSKIGTAASSCCRRAGRMMCWGVVGFQTKRSGGSGIPKPP